MKLILDVISGPESGRTFEFRQADTFVVGRSQKAHLVLDPGADRYISRTHFLLDFRPPRCLITDLESTNGLYVNDSRVRQAELHDGDQFRAGRSSFVVRLSEPEGTLGGSWICNQCGLDVSNEAPIDSTEPYRCRLCRAKKSAPQTPVVEGAPPRYACDVCGVDLSDEARADGRAGEFPGASYLCAGCLPSARDPSLRPERLGSFRLLRELGQGGMGIVYKAVHEPSRRLCAVKKILPSVVRDERAIRLFEREMDIQSFLQHPNLLRVQERGRDRGAPFCAIELMPGGDAERLITQDCRGPLDPALACKILIDVLTGLEALHGLGFVHRDLKPANILLTASARDRDFSAKIADWGLAKCFEEAGNSIFDFTQAGEACGTLLYMSPEQILDYRYVRPSTDVYAAGMSLYYLLTARYSMEFPTPLDLLKRAMRGGQARNPIEVILEDPPIPLLERNPALPKTIAKIVDQAVEKERHRRFASASAFRESLEQAAARDGVRLS